MRETGVCVRREIWSKCARVGSLSFTQPNQIDQFKLPCPRVLLVPSDLDLLRGFLNLPVNVNL